MAHDSVTTPSTYWGSNGSGGDVTINSLYELRETLENIASAVELSPKFDDNVRHSNTSGRSSIFELNQNGEFAKDEFGQTIPRQHIGSVNTHYNETINGYWESTQYTSLNQWGTNEIYSALLQRYDDGDTNSTVTVIGLDLDTVNIDPNFGPNVDRYNNASTENTSVQQEFEEQDVLLRLSSDFWNDLGNVYSSDVNSSAEISIDSSFNGKVLDLDSISTSDYKELRDEINNALDLKFISEDPLYSAEFTSHINGNAVFRNTASGAQISLNITDIDDSGWPSGGSGLGAVEVDYDEFGNHIQTEIEFGVSEWSVEQFLSSANQAFEYNNSAPPSSIENFGSASTQRWDLDSIDVWSNGTPNGIPSNNLQDLFDESLQNQEISFYTSFSGYQDGEAYFTPKLEVYDYVNNIVDFQTGESGFDLELIGPNQSNVLSKPSTNNYSANLHYQAFNTDTSIPITEFGMVNVHYNTQYDGLGTQNFDFNTASLNDIDNRYPEYANTDASIDFYLKDFNLHSYSNDPLVGSSQINFHRDNQNELFRITSSSGAYQGQGIEAAFPNIDLVDTFTLLNAFNPSSAYPLNAQLELLEDYGDEALAFTYALSNTSNNQALSQNAVLGDSVDHYSTYNLDIFAESLVDDFRLEATDFTINFNPLLFENISASDIRIDGVMPVANAVSIDNEVGTIRIAAASLSDLTTGEDPYGNLGYGIGTDPQKLATISLDFSESQIENLARNPDGSLVISPLAFEIETNLDETIFSQDFYDDNGLLNREILSLDDLGGGVDVDGQDVTLYEAKINFKQLGDGLVIGTDRVIGSDASFTNLIRSGDLLTTKSEWLNVGNIQANNLNYSALYNQNATLENADFSQTSVASGSFIDGVFVEDARESTTLTTDIRITGAAGNVVDLSDGIVSIQSDGSEVFTNKGKGSSNLITFQGDLNYDGRVSMKDLAYLNAGAARQQLVTTVDQHGNTVEVASEASYARDVDADFSGKIDLADLSVLDADWGKTLHTGDEQFQGSSEVSWTELDEQGDDSSWDNDSFKNQNEIETYDDYVGSLESPAASNVIGADGNTSANDGDITGTYFQETA